MVNHKHISFVLVFDEQVKLLQELFQLPLMLTGFSRLLKSPGFFLENYRTWKVLEI